MCNRRPSFSRNLPALLPPHMQHCAGSNGISTVGHAFEPLSRLVLSHRSSERQRGTVTSAKNSFLRNSTMRSSLTVKHEAVHPLLQDIAVIVIMGTRHALQGTRKRRANGQLCEWILGSSSPQIQFSAGRKYEFWSWVAKKAMSITVKGCNPMQ